MSIWINPIESVWTDKLYHIVYAHTVKIKDGIEYIPRESQMKIGDRVQHDSGRTGIVERIVQDITSTALTVRMDNNDVITDAVRAFAPAKAEAPAPRRTSRK